MLYTIGYLQKIVNGNTFKGEYEYPNIIDAGTEIDHDIDPHKVLYLSNPSARCW